MAVNHSTNTSDNNYQYVSGYLLTILRIYLGVILLYTVIGKLTGSSPFSIEMLGFINFEIKARQPMHFYVSFLQSVIIPNAQLFSYLIMAGELIAGLGFLLGAFTRFSAIIAMVLFVNYMLTKGHFFWSPNSEDAAVFFIALILYLGKAGRFFGLDSIFEKRWPKLF